MNDWDPMVRKLHLHSELDQIFSAACDLSQLPAVISEIGSRHLGCEFISMWLCDPAERLLVNLLAREHVSPEASPEPELPQGWVRIRAERGPGKGALANLAAAVLEGERFEDMAPEDYIINDRPSDPRQADQLEHLDLSTIRSEMYAPMIFNGFKGMLSALNHQADQFSQTEFELLEIVANKTAIVVDNLEARRRAEEAQRLASLGKSIDMVRHELLSPLTAIKGAANVIVTMLGRGPLTDEGRATLLDLAEMIPHEVDRNVRMLEDIREYCRPRLELLLVRGDLNSFLCEQMEALSNITGWSSRERVQIQMDLENGLPAALLSRDHLLAVLRNLVRNSAERRCHKVRISTRREELPDDERFVVVTVQDHGGGIDEKRIDMLFRPYETTRGHVGGSGLGLFICRRIIEEGHAGRIKARNIYEDGTRVGLAVDIHLRLAPPERAMEADSGTCR